MGDIPQVIWIIGGVAIVMLVALIVAYALGTRRVGSRSHPSGSPPDWVRATTPRPRPGGEEIASDVVEQVEDILHQILNDDPELARMNVDFGTAPDGGLAIWVDGERYVDVNALPDERLRQAVQRAIKSWNER